MGVTLPAEAAAMLELLGLPWPNIDEDEIRKDADAWRIVIAHAGRAAAEVEETMGRTARAYIGESATSLASYWNETGNNGGHLSQAVAAAAVVPRALDHTAALTTAVKLAIGTAAVYTTVKAGRAFLTGGPFGAAVASAEMFRARQTIGRIQREGAEGAGKVLAPALRRRVVEELRRILQQLRHPGGGGGPALAVPGGGRVPAGRGGLAAEGGGRDAGRMMMGRKGWFGNSSDAARKAAEDKVASDGMQMELRADGLRRHADLEKELGDDAIVKSDLKGAQQHWGTEESIREQEQNIRRGGLNN